MTNEREKLPYGIAILALFGLVLSLYAVRHHMRVRVAGSTDAACNVSEIVSCDRVALSSLSELAGVPLGVFGVVFFAMELGAFAALAVRMQGTFVLALLSFLIIAGAVVSLLLAALSAAMLSAFCLVCVGVYGACWTQFAFRPKSHPRFPARVFFFPGMFVAFVAAIFGVGFRFLKPTLMKAEARGLYSGFHGGGTARDLDLEVNDVLLDRSLLTAFPHNGRLTAPVLLVSFVDPMCPYCAATAPVLEELFRRHQNDILSIDIPYPLSSKCNSNLTVDLHPRSCELTRAALCAQKSGVYRRFITRILEDRPADRTKSVAQLLATESVAEEKAIACLESVETERLLKTAVALGKQLKITATPKLYFNGRLYVGTRDLDALEQILAQVRNTSTH
jgi:uncharacterized membrane protein/predicted DsbA family dithiol-disulfide isomerase